MTPMKHKRLAVLAVYSALAVLAPLRFSWGQFSPKKVSLIPNVSGVGLRINPAVPAALAPRFQPGPVKSIIAGGAASAQIGVPARQSPAGALESVKNFAAELAPQSGEKQRSAAAIQRASNEFFHHAAALGSEPFAGVNAARAVKRVNTSAKAAESSREKKKGPYGKYRWRPMDKSLTYVLDGDTVYYGKRTSGRKLKIRVLGIDTPEVPHFAAGKFLGQPYGKEATLLAREIVRKGKKVKYLPTGKDRYGRTLAHILVDEELLAVSLIKKGLAYESITTYGDNGLPALSKIILAASKKYPLKDFERPRAFRHRVWTPEWEAAELKKDLGRRRTLMNKSLVKFDDGDTIRYKGTTLRISGVDTPEIMHKEDGIFEDQPYGRTAAAYTKKLILNAKKVEYILGEKDKYGRTLAHVFIDGELLSVLLLKKSLGYEIISNFGPGEFPGFARLILAAARSAPTPKFERPMYWRGKHQKKP